MNIVRPRLKAEAAAQRHVALNYPSDSSALKLAKQGEGDGPMRLVSATLDKAPSCCRPETSY